MTSKHTPGPWRLVKTVTRGEFCWDYKIRSEDDSAICTMGPVARDANARLIAEAPAMLEALRDLIDQLRGIGIPDWHGAEGLDLSLAESILSRIDKGAE